jgi:hypothetical protein
MKVLHREHHRITHWNSDNCDGGSREDGPGYKVERERMRDKLATHSTCYHNSPASTAVPWLLRFRGSLFYVVERYKTTAIPHVDCQDCHKDLHRSVEKVYSFKKCSEQL